jgi:serine/threonine protein kinase
LTPERWTQIEELFHRAAECDPARRASLLDAACSVDPELRREIEALLSCDRDAGQSFLAAVHSELDAVGFPLTGETVSHYRILEGLGGGGMGSVYRAEDIRLGRQVALKFLPEESLKNPASLGRFEREARSASALEHPNICPIYEFGEHEGQPFLAMQLLEGQTLREHIGAAESGTPPFELADLLNLAIQIVDGLDAAHRHGIIHRDIKPANIFVTSQGQAKILDFGLAKPVPVMTVAGNESDPDNHHNVAADGTAAEVELRGTPDLFLSRTGVAMGTAGYMSPEQARGEKLDARTDLFSFGLVLYEMATGERAFKGDTGPSLHDAILKQMPAPARELNPKLPARLEKIIGKALEKDRECRYQTASEMRADMGALQQMKHAFRWWAVGLSAAATIAFSTILFVLNRPLKTVSVVPEIKLRQLTVNSSDNPVAGGAISPDGKYLAYIDTRGLHLKVIDTGETRTVPKSEVTKDPSMNWEVGPWFPDGTRLLINVLPSREQWNEPGPIISSIWAVSVPGRVPTKLRDHAFAWSVSPDGSLVSFGTGKTKIGVRELWLMGPNGENARKFQETNEGGGIGGFGWSPEGKRYTYVLANSSGNTLLSGDIQGGPTVTLFQSSEFAKLGDVNWLHDGRVVYSLAEPGNDGVCNYWTMRLDLATGRHLEEPRRLTNWPNFCVFSGSSTNDDKRLAFVASSGFYTSYVADLDAGGKRLLNIRRFTLEDADNVQVGWTADGKVMVAQNRDKWSLYKQSLDSDTPEPIVSSVAGGALLAGAITPDGKWYIGRIWPDGESIDHPTIPFPILRIPLAGGTPETILQLSRHGNVSCARPPSNICVLAEPSEDRKQVIVSIMDPIKGRGPELFRSNVDRVLGAIEVPPCVVSPDGTRLAIARNPESPLEIRSLHGQIILKIPSQSVGELDWLNWSADQKGFFVTRKSQSGNELLYLDFQGKATSLRKCGGGASGVGGGCGGSPSPDGRHLAVDDKNQSNNIWMMEHF